jgi:hypothetical protein
MNVFTAIPLMTFWKSLLQGFNDNEATMRKQIDHTALIQMFRIISEQLLQYFEFITPRVLELLGDVASLIDFQLCLDICTILSDSQVLQYAAIASDAAILSLFPPIFAIFRIFKALECIPDPPDQVFAFLNSLFVHHLSLINTQFHDVLLDLFVLVLSGIEHQLLCAIRCFNSVLTFLDELDKIGKQSYVEFNETFQIMADSLITVFIVNHRLDWSLLASALSFHITFNPKFPLKILDLVAPLAFYAQTELNKFVNNMKTHTNDRFRVYEDLILLKRLFVSARVELRESPLS